MPESSRSVGHQNLTVHTAPSHPTTVSMPTPHISSVTYMLGEGKPRHRRRVSSAQGFKRPKLHPQEVHREATFVELTDELLAVPRPVDDTLPISSYYMGTGT